MSETYVPGHQNNPGVLVFVNPSKFLGNQDAKILKMEKGTHHISRKINIKNGLVACHMGNPRAK